MNKHKPGEFGYYEQKRLRVIIFTIIYFAISVALYIVGYVTTGSNKNLLTIVAVLGMLPASKSAVSMIMYLRYHGCEKELYDRLNDTVEHFLHAYGLVLTTYKKNFEVPVCIVKNSYVYVLLKNHQEDISVLKKHMEDMIKQNGYKATVGVYTDEKEYVKRLCELKEKADDNVAADENLLTLMLQISL